eukprot:747534-Hanusia_phi.AAC.1
MAATEGSLSVGGGPESGRARVGVSRRMKMKGLSETRSCRWCPVTAPSIFKYQYRCLTVPYPAGPTGDVRSRPARRLSPDRWYTRPGGPGTTRRGQSFENGG